MTDHLSRAHQLLASVQLDKARIYLMVLLALDPDNMHPLKPDSTQHFPRHTLPQGSLNWLQAILKM